MVKLICFLGLLFAGVTANAAPISFQGSERQTSLLELASLEKADTSARSRTFIWFCLIIAIIILWVLSRK